MPRCLQRCWPHLLARSQSCLLPPEHLTPWAHSVLCHINAHIFENRQRMQNHHPILQMGKARHRVQCPQVRGAVASLPFLGTPMPPLSVPPFTFSFAMWPTTLAMTACLCVRPPAVAGSRGEHSTARQPGPSRAAQTVQAVDPCGTEEVCYGYTVWDQTGGFRTSQSLQSANRHRGPRQRGGVPYSFDHGICLWAQSHSQHHLLVPTL